MFTYFHAYLCCIFILIVFYYISILCYCSLYLGVFLFEFILISTLFYLYFYVVFISLLSYLHCHSN